MAHREQKSLCVAIKLHSLWEPEPVSGAGTGAGVGEGQGGSSGFGAPHPSWEGLGAQQGLLGDWRGVSVGLSRQAISAGPLRFPTWAQPFQWWDSPQAQLLPWAPLGEVRPTPLPSVVLGEV